ncbi:hypothetical protein IID24_04380 [Patescibacteria group bacterium]|nr:hypothetical protein [Patescibacteria group bacterium]
MSVKQRILAIMAQIGGTQPNMDDMVGTVIKEDNWGLFLGELLSQIKLDIDEPENRQITVRQFLDLAVPTPVTAHPTPVPA